MAWTHYSVHLEAKHNTHLPRPLMLYCTGEESGLVNQIHWHESHSTYYSLLFICTKHQSPLRHHISLSLSLFPFSFPFFLAYSNLAAPVCPQGGMKIKSEDLQCGKEHDLCICCVTGWQHQVCGTLVSFLCAEDSFTGWFFHVRGSILSCPAMFKNHLSINCFA